MFFLEVSLVVSTGRGQRRFFVGFVFEAIAGLFDGGEEFFDPRTPSPMAARPGVSDLEGSIAATLLMRVGGVGWSVVVDPVEPQ